MKGAKGVMKMVDLKEEGKLTKEKIRSEIKEDQKTSLGKRWVFVWKGETHVAFGSEDKAVDELYGRLK
jgi:hypothetical protein